MLFFIFSPLPFPLCHSLSFLLIPSLVELSFPFCFIFTHTLSLSQYASDASNEQKPSFPQWSHNNVAPTKEPNASIFPGAALSKSPSFSCHCPQFTWWLNGDKTSLNPILSKDIWKVWLGEFINNANSGKISDSCPLPTQFLEMGAGMRGVLPNLPRLPHNTHGQLRSAIYVLPTINDWKKGPQSNCWRLKHNRDDTLLSAVHPLHWERLQLSCIVCVSRTVT